MWELETWCCSACRQQTVRQPVRDVDANQKISISPKGPGRWKQIRQHTLWVFSPDTTAFKKCLLTGDQEARGSTCWPEGELQPDATVVEAVYSF